MCLNSGLSVHKQLVTLVGACNVDSQARTEAYNHHLNSGLIMLITSSLQGY